MSSVLLVDDQPFVLAALERELLRKPEICRGGLEIESFVSPDAALQRARTRQGGFDAAVVDYRMPGMDGITFLRALRDISPDAARVVLSSHGDMETLAKAINIAHIDAFIEKPWNEYDLKRVLLHGLMQAELKAENRRLAEQLLGDGTRARPEPQRTYAVMAVDDDDFVLAALKRELDRWNPGCFFTPFDLSLSLFTRPQDALAEAQRRPVDLVIADYAMPGMNGIELLRKIRQARPDAARILLSGKANLSVLIDAVNVAGVIHFVAKPWREYELTATILQALAYRNAEIENRQLADLARQPQHD